MGVIVNAHVVSEIDLHLKSFSAGSILLQAVKFKNAAPLKLVYTESHIRPK